MKNKLRFLLVCALTFVLACLTAAPAAAADYDFTADGVYYKVVSASDLTCRVTYGGDKYTGDVVIPENVAYGVSKFSVTEIGDSAFYECTDLTSVTIPNSVTEIGESAFLACSGMTSITIGNSVTKIGEYAISGCTGLTSITIPNSVTSIGECAFFANRGLTSVTIGNSVTEIGDCAFYDCTGLTSVTIPNSVTKIDGDAFSGCAGLTSVTIPNSVTKIDRNAFRGCTGLTSVTCLAKTPPDAHTSTFSNDTYLGAILYVPTGTSDSYSSADCWKNFYIIKEGTSPSAINNITLDQNGETSIFDLQDHRLAQPKKGINIINGKKVLVK